MLMVKPKKTMMTMIRTDPGRMWNEKKSLANNLKEKNAFLKYLKEESNGKIEYVVNMSLYEIFIIVQHVLHGAYFYFKGSLVFNAGKILQRVLVT